MSDNSPRLDLPYLQPAQAQKHVTHNEALRALDVLVQLTVTALDATTPPTLPLEGAVYAIGDGASGAWAGHDGELGAYVDAAWQFHTPLTGWIATLQGTTELYTWDGSGWALALPATLNNLEGVGVNTTADATNRLAVASPATLLSHEGADHQLKINKATEADTASLLFQDNWSGRAELGLTGDDDFRLKVSPDGATWADAMVLDASTGAATFPAGITGFTERLTADRTYYVRSDGSDANDGLSDSAGGAFLTVQKAVDSAATLYCGPYTVTVQIGAGTFNEGTYLYVPGNGNLRLVLAGAGASDTTIAGTTYGIQISGACQVTLRDLKLVGASVTFWARYGAQVFLRGTLEFGTGSARLIGADNGAYVEALSCTIRIGVANSAYFLYATGGGHIYFGSGVTVATTEPVTFTATVSSTLTAIAQIIASQVSWDETNGAISGARYFATGNAVLNTAGGGASYIPGSTAGSTATGGQYV